MTTDVNFGAISEALNDKTDRDMQNVDTVSGADGVIEFQKPTAENNYTWYRLYASGWCEQGGKFAAYSATVTLPKQYKDTNYTASSITIRNGAPSSGEGCASVYIVSSTQLFVSSGAGSYGGFWEAKGFVS